MSTPGTIRTRDLGGRNALLCPLSYGGLADASVSAQRLSPELLPARMQHKIQTADSDCWIWVGARNSRGYGCIFEDGRARLAHRRAYELLVGPIDALLTIDHLCRNKACVAPSHLEVVTRAENTRRKPRRSHCPAGHALEGTNLRTRVRANGRLNRECRECALLRQRARYRRPA